MFIPKLKVSIVDFETNARFICNYCSKEKEENNTRPFFEKTLMLYPELEKVRDMADCGEQDGFIRQAVIKRLTENRAEIEARTAHFQEVFDSFIPEFIEAQCKLFNYEWRESDPIINCYVGYTPFYPRSTEDKCFYVSYQDEERVFSGAVHEINHMVFFEKWKEMHGATEEKQWPNPLWYLEEIIVDPTLNDERVKKHTLYDNKAYPQFYEVGADGVSLMDLVKECYRNSANIETFLDDSYEIIKKKVGGKV